MVICNLLRGGDIELQVIDEGYGLDQADILRTDKALEALRFSVMVADGYTVYDFFKMLTKYSALQQLDEHFESLIETFEQSRFTMDMSRTQSTIIVGYIVEVSFFEFEDEDEVCQRYDEAKASNGSIVFDRNKAVMFEDRSIDISAGVKINYPSDPKILLRPMNEILNTILVVPANLTIDDPYTTISDANNSELYNGVYRSVSEFTLYQFITTVAYSLYAYGDEEAKQELLSNNE